MIWREANRDDVAAVVALLADDALGKSRETDELSVYLSAFEDMQRETGNSLIVGDQDGRVVACYQLCLISGLSISAARRAIIEGVRVASDLRGQGVGALLIADAEARARQGGCALIQLTTNAVRKDAQRFYERLGFTASHIGFKKPL